MVYGFAIMALRTTVAGRPDQSVKPKGFAARKNIRRQTSAIKFGSSGGAREVTLFSNPAHFRNTCKTTEKIYSEGVLCLQRNDYYGANAFFKTAAEGGNTSALYNLALIHGMGSISPWDIDFSIDCFRRAAAGGHPKAKEFSMWLDKAEDTTFGTMALAKFATTLPAQNEPNHLLMMVGCRLYNALCVQYNAADFVIESELDAARHSEHHYIHNFIKRTGISNSVYPGGLNRIEGGSAADQLTDGLNYLHVGLKRGGHSDQICLLIRCTIVGYVISKSRHARRAMPLLGTDKFFA